jgi:hypothetical protein
VRTPPDSRDEYLSILKDVGSFCQASANVKGFYLMECAEHAGNFWEFYEFADEDAAGKFAEEVANDLGQQELIRRLREIVPEELTDTSFWNQRF